MAPKQPCITYKFVAGGVTVSTPHDRLITPQGPKTEENVADYNAGGYLPIQVGDTFRDRRYKVVRKLGWGHFSTVWLVKDSKTKRHSALKVVKSAGRYAETAKDEIKLLSRALSFSPSHPGRQHIVSFLDSFCHQGPEASHVCIVFEPLGENLLALIERHKKKGVPRPLVKAIARQILLGLEYLHDECDLVHTDIKPENVCEYFPSPFSPRPFSRRRFHRTTHSLPFIQLLPHLLSFAVYNGLRATYDSAGGVIFVLIPYLPTSLLISIPDIEDHIHNELSRSPSPVSTRVALPMKRTAGVSIPQKHQQKQVTIIHSQPLSSPGRSLGKSFNPLASMSMKVKQETGAAESAKESSSLTASTQSRTIGYLGQSGTVGALSSNAARLVNNLSVAQNESVFDKKRDELTTTKSIAAAASSTNCPSSSSSSSSISSSAIDLTSSGSLVSTPPTSLPHSLGTTVTEFLGLGRTLPKAIPVEVKVTQESKNESELGVLSSSWKATTEIVGSLKEKVSAFAKSSSSPSMTKKAVPPSHERSHSGISAHGFYPGAGGPAPAIVVSAVVNADRQQTDFTKDSTVDAIGPMSTAASAILATRPSPIGAPHGAMPKATPLLNGQSKLGPSRDILPDDASSIHGSSPICDSLATTKTDMTTPHLSLLTRTAPIKISNTTSPSKRTDTRVSPPRHVSQLSAHMHAHKPSQPDVRTKTKSRTSRLVEHPPVSVGPTVTSSTSITPTPASPTVNTPLAPPPSPADESPIASQIPERSAEAGTPPAVAEGDQAPPLRTEVDKPLPPAISVKIADLGNATPSQKHFTEDIQTRQYRAPEAILGRSDWDARADIWSVACVVFELLTAEYLFDPQGQGEIFNKDDDHMAQIIELMGDFPLSVKMDGKFSRELFDQTGALRYIKTLKPWPLKRVMMEKYLYPEADAVALGAFLEPMLQPDMRSRARARDLKDHPWLQVTKEDGVVLEW
ncbi:hypothetical protein D9619_003398 [Psilocybe cf. subviscida]|uniref:non-specific serine/threonine protein kinase n=1 Tax=Psilocybe cf. subviscida TaxID=2480587 RepID=A0A8H5AWQ5_9AGAR|nr:hypothetical protein D9619_003398 [Psilocybe cf. subviscida]